MILLAVAKRPYQQLVGLGWDAAQTFRLCLPSVEMVRFVLPAQSLVMLGSRTHRRLELAE